MDYMEQASVCIVDDEISVRKSLKLLMESAGLRALTCESAEEFLASPKIGDLGCVILDLRLGGMSGIQLLTVMRERGIDVPAIMITGHGDVPAAVASMKLGAVDFIEKPCEPSALLAKVQEALARSLVQKENKVHLESDRSRFSSLTAREMDILQMIIDGKSTKQIAYDTGLSQKTVSNHRAHLLAKTGAENTADLVRMAVVIGVGKGKPPAQAATSLPPIR